MTRLARRNSPDWEDSSISVAEAAPWGQVVGLTADEFFGMIEAGLFARERRVFLWDGRLCEKAMKTPTQALTTALFNKALWPRLTDDRWLLWPENPVRLDGRHAPLSEITVVRGPLERYRDEDRHPEAADAGLLVEVIESSPKGLDIRAEQFALGMVPAYWVVDVSTNIVIEHRNPRVVGGVGSFVVVQSHGLDGAIPLVLDGHEIARIPVRELLG